MGDEAAPKKKKGELVRITEGAHFLASELAKTLTKQLDRNVTIGEVVADAIRRYRQEVAETLGIESPKAA